MSLYGYHHVQIKQKPRYRIRWEFEDGKIIGYFVYTMNVEAIELFSSYYIPLCEK